MYLNFGKCEDYRWANAFNLTKEQDDMLLSMIDEMSMVDSLSGWRLKEARDKIYRDEAFSSKDNNILFRIIKGHFLLNDKQVELAQYLKDRNKEVYWY